MAGKRLAVFDPSGRLIQDLRAAAETAQVELVAIKAPDRSGRQEPAKPDRPDGAVLVAPLVASDLGPAPAAGPPRWIVGDGANPARLAGAAAQAGAAGVLLTPVAPATLAALANAEATSVEADLARARRLIATSLIDLTGAAHETLQAVAEAFGAEDCVVWWKDGHQMTPTASRPFRNEAHRTQVAGAARIAAAAAGTAVAGAAPDGPRAVIAEALRSSATEVAGLVAIVAGAPRLFTAAERTDLKAIAARLARELSWLTSHRRLVAEGERLLASSLHDPLTSAMTRGAFEQTIAHEAAAAARRRERLTLAVFDVVGLRRINLEHGHPAGDEVLAQVASRIRATVRGNDPIGRLGGDEIACLLVGAPEEQATLVARKVITKIRSEPIVVDGSALTISVKAVATEMPATERSGEAAFARCYSALRQAPVDDVRVVPADERISDDSGSESGALSAGTVVGGTYRIMHELSRGAMGVVYRGEDLGLGRSVAIKVLRSDLASDRDLVTRFRNEAGILASIHHPNLVAVYALGEHAGEVYFVMELVEGQPLSELLRDTGARKEFLPIAAVSTIALEISDALDAMHTLGVIHRDVKPANILLDRERGRAVLVDVGVAVKAGDQRDAAGTPGFAAPESFTEHSDSPATDVYGLAATVYCMLTGRPPFGSGPAPQVVQRQLHDQMMRPSQIRPTLSPAVDEVLAKALAPDRKRRYGQASTFAVALGRALDRLPQDQTVPMRVVPVEDDPVKNAEALLAPTSGLDAADLKALPSARIVSGRVRAAHLRVLSRLVRAHLGESGTAKLVTETPRLAQPFAATLAMQGWVDLADLVVALDRARAKIASQLVPRKVGRDTITATFPQLFGADPTHLPAETVLAALPAAWPRYHDWSELQIDVSPGCADVALLGYPGSTDVCVLVGAELERIVEMTGAIAVAAAHVACACNGARRCEFRVSWSVKTD